MTTTNQNDLQVLVTYPDSKGEHIENGCGYTRFGKYELIETPDSDTFGENESDYEPEDLT